ncbi:translocation protein SEC66 [Metschnikowia aff. pulcherrima]|uniref:Translocation protein SEC66 n=1 Tax=Metschnikowia aff. pulcherrima TaxID=2163413 RepID=A0A4V1AEC8_9ASCO|nr:translocation protein SEC66 [Metschnikowia aff. pulcherrima]
MAEEEKVEQVLRISVYTPLVYVGVMVTAFAIFSVLYRRHRLRKLIGVEPLFAHNHALDLYTAVKDKYYDKLAPKDERPPEKAVKAALLRRAVEAIRRSLKLKENEVVFNRLYQEGLIGDDVFQQFVLQNKVQQAELSDIVQESRQFSAQWPEAFFPVAQEICFNEALRRRLNAMDDRSESLLEMWNYYVDKADDAAKKIK